MTDFFSTLNIHDIRLKVLNLEAAARFYRDIIGLKEIGREGRDLRLSANGRDPSLIVLEGDSGALPRPITAPGLFHTALLFPNRLELARTVRHVGEMGWKFQGFADHGVSEAVYLADSEGNGLELYCDRPRTEWPVGSNGIAMVTEPLDVAGLMAELDGTAPLHGGIHPDVVVGHLHLQISNLQRGEAFYHETLGLDVTQRSYPGALFLSADGYHHHIGLNIWNSRGSGPADEKATGLQSFELAISPSRLKNVSNRLLASGKAPDVMKENRISDPDGISVVLSVLDKNAPPVHQQ